MKTFYILSITLLFSLSVLAQSTPSINCGFDPLHQDKITTDRSYFIGTFKNDQEWYEYVSTDQRELPRSEVILPVVFHIIHQNGAENISDGQVQSALSDLNLSFSNSGYYNPSTGTDTEIQFCMARRDPEGNNTSGITRTASSLTNLDANVDDQNMKDLARWDPKSYINIYVVKDICRGSDCGVAGYAYLPSAHGQKFDGIVLEARYVGSSQSRNTVLTHEMGHYLGLYHTFQGGCQNNDCQNDGDKVCDTPPDNTTAYTACNGDMNSCTSDEDDTSTNNPFRSPALGGLGDQDDQFQNYMDYSRLECYDQFTEGQKERMHFFINNIRQSLLTSLSCQTPCQNKVIAEINNSVQEIAQGTVVNFQNASVNANSYRWYINDSLFSTERDPSFAFNAEGLYTIILESISDDSLMCASDYDTLEIVVTCSTLAAFEVRTNGLQLTTQNQSQFHNSSVWSLRDQNGQELFSSVMENFNYDLNEAGWYQLCLQVDGSDCEDRYCEYFYILENSSNNKCQASLNKIFYSENRNYYDIKISRSNDGSIYVGGVRENDYFISKVTSDGDEIWNKEFKLFTNLNGERRLYSLHEDADGNILLTADIDKNHGIIIQFDPFDLEIEWAKSIENSSLRSYNVFETDDNLSYILTGHVNSCTEASFVRISKSNGANEQFFGFNLEKCLTFFGGLKDGNHLYLCGRYSLSNRANSYRPSVSCIDVSGNEIWSKTYFYSRNRNARFYNYDICKTKNGYFVVGAGDHNGSDLDNFIPHLYLINDQGNLIWSKTFSVPNKYWQSIYDIKPHSNGYYLLGDYKNISNANSDLLIMNINESGNLIWSKKITYKGIGGNTLRDINAKSQNTLVLENDTLLIVINSGNKIIWSKIAENGETNSECDLIYDVVVEVKAGPTFEMNQNLVPSNHNFSIDFDIVTPSNFTYLNEPLCGLPDISLRIDSTWCTSLSGYIAQAQIEVCNNGIAPFSGKIPISVYDQNPTKSNAQLVLKDTLLLGLPIDTCFSLTIPILHRDNTNGTFFIVVNDDNSLSPNYDLDQDFPVTDIDECTFRNNLDSFYFEYINKSIDLGPDVDTCDNTPVTFHAGSNFDSYQWNDASTDSILSASRSGTYWVTAKDECGIAYSDTVRLNYIAQTQVDLGLDTTICMGDSITLSTPNSFIEYKWFPEGAFDCPECTDVTFAPDTNITVILTAESAPGCFSSDSVRINVKDPIELFDSLMICKGDTINYNGFSIADTGQVTLHTGNCDTSLHLSVNFRKVLNKDIDLGPDLFFCDDTSVTFKAPSGFESYQWSNNSTDSLITISEEGLYWVLAKDECGGTHSDTVRFNIDNTPKIDFPDDTTICFGDSLEVNATDGYAQYLWTPAYAVNCRSCQSTTVTTDSTITIHLEVRTDSGCISRDSFQLKVNYKDKIRDTISFCKGDSLYYLNRLIDQAGIYQFNLGGFCDTTLYLHVDQTDLTPLLSDIDLDFIDGLNDLPGQTYDIQLDLDPEVWNVEWSPSQFFSCDNCLKTSIYAFNETRILSIKLTHESGCVYYKEFPLSWVKTHTLYIPNIFTPNGDGINDTWQIIPTPLVDQINNLKIYNRWGELIREWQNVEQISWDGKMKGKPLDPAVFVYALEYRTITGNTNFVQGTFSLVR